MYIDKVAIHQIFEQNSRLLLSVSLVLRMFGGAFFIGRPRIYFFFFKRLFVIGFHKQVLNDLIKVIISTHKWIFVLPDSSKFYRSCGSLVYRTFV